MPKLCESVLLGAALLLGCVANAAVPRVDLGLTQGPATCDGGKGTYKYVVTWKARGVSRQYQVNSGNHCQLGGTVCGVSSKTCYTTCTASGECSAPVSACQAGRGGAWIQAYATLYSGYQRIVARGPGPCQ